MRSPWHFFTLVAFGLLIIGLMSTSQGSRADAYLAVIIDDLGHSEALGLAALELPQPVSYAVIPFTPFAKMLAQKANEKNLEIMLHMPMSNTKHNFQSESMLSPEMSKDSFLAAVENNLTQFPNIVGVNNHMGSEMTQYYAHMRWLMQSLYGRGLYFIDSRTTAESPALQAAKDSGIASDRRHVFLDNNDDQNDINNQLDVAINKARASGFAIAIGHPYGNTLTVLKKRLAALSSEGVTAVSVSNYLSLKQSQQP